MYVLKNDNKPIQSYLTLSEKDGNVSCTCLVGTNVISFSNNNSSNKIKEVSQNDYKDCILKAILSTPEIAMSDEIRIFFLKEPSLNLKLLGIARNLKQIMRPYVNCDIIVPSVVTELPKGSEDVNIFIKNWIDIKNNEFNGNSKLGFFIGSTDEKIRKEITKSKNVLSLEEVSNKCKDIKELKGSKIDLIFELENGKIDFEKISKLFNNNIFAIRLIQTQESLNNTSIKIVKGFINKGFKVFVYKDIYKEKMDNKLK